MIGFLTFLETPWHDYLLLAVLVALVLLAAVGAVELVDMAVSAWRGRRSPKPAPETAAPVAPFASETARAALDDAYAHATAQAEAVAENGFGWNMPSREQVEREVAEVIDPAAGIAERGITELEAWLNSGPSGSDGSS